MASSTCTWPRCSFTSGTSPLVCPTRNSMSGYTCSCKTPRHSMLVLFCGTRRSVRGAALPGNWLQDWPGKTLPLPCVSTAFVAETMPLPSFLRPSWLRYYVCHAFPLPS